MKTIEELVEEHTAPGVNAALVAALVEREQEAVDRLNVIASKFGLLPAVVSKVVCDLGLGEPCSEEQKKFIDEQYQHLLEQSRQHAQQQIEAMRQMGIPLPEGATAQVRDPLADGEDIVIPDTPPEA